MGFLVDDTTKGKIFMLIIVSIGKVFIAQDLMRIDFVQLASVFRIDFL